MLSSAVSSETEVALSAEDSLSAEEALSAEDALTAEDAAAEDAEDASLAAWLSPHAASVAPQSRITVSIAILLFIVTTS